MDNKIFGFSFAAVENVNAYFDEVFNDSESAFYVSKKEYTHEEDDYKFKYRYAIEAVWCDGIYYSLMLVPSAGSLTDKKRESIADCCGVGVEEITPYDIASYGCAVTMDSIKVDNEDIEKRSFDRIATVYDVIDRMRGFYLDRAVNRIGTSGWDLLDDFINGHDFISKAFSK